MFRGKSGFTLVELLIAIAIIGIIASVGVKSSKTIIDGFKYKADVESAKVIARQLEIKVLAGEIKTNQNNLVDEMYPKSKSNGVKLKADISFSEEKCVVSVKDDLGFSYSIEIAKQVLE